MEIVFATNNLHKLEEIAALLGQEFHLLGLKDLDIKEEIPEDFETLEENASQKAWYIYNKTGKNCFADDTGLEVQALNGEPGVMSARYAGPAKDSEENILKSIKEETSGYEKDNSDYSSFSSSHCTHGTAGNLHQ